MRKPTRFCSEKPPGRHDSVKDRFHIPTNVSLLGIVLLILLAGMGLVGAGAQSGDAPPLQLQAAPPPDLPHRVFLPVVPRSVSTDPAMQVLDRLNYYRALAGAPPFQLYPAIVQAAQNHARYYMLNYADPSAWIYTMHGEVEGKPGFTGRYLGDRLEYTGFPYWGGAEEIHYLGDPVASVEDWIAAPYHRIFALKPYYNYMGYAMDRNAEAAVDVLDFGFSDGPALPPEPIAYPADGHTGVPTTWGGGEDPDPLPPGAPRPVGYAFSLQGVGGTFHVTWIEMRDGNNQVVAVYPNPDLCPDFKCYIMIPVSPLQPLMTYTVHAIGSVSGVPFDQYWHFTTRAEAQGAGSNLQRLEDGRPQLDAGPLAP
jgi:uncharacterized protein YkwD